MPKQLAQLIDAGSPAAVLSEVQLILRLIEPGFNTQPVTRAFQTAVDLYQGRFPGYRACNTLYHDLGHITDVFLAMARLIHGAVLDGYVFDGRSLSLALISTLFHDAGLIQTDDDTEGTGAKYLADHDQRSLEFLKAYGQGNGWDDMEIAAACFLISCTDLRNEVASISFESLQIEQLGRLLAAADLIAQMADRLYLEKLLYLYHEFKEGNIGDYIGELDLLHKTVDFFDFVETRLASIQAVVDRYAHLHFNARWRIDANLYGHAMNRQKQYLQHILQQPGDPRDHLRRQDIVQNVRKIYGTG